MIDAVTALAPLVGVVAACAALGVPRSTYYRWRARTDAPADGPLDAMPAPAQAADDRQSAARRPARRTLSVEEREAVLEVLNSARFVDMAPREVYATLLDEGVYLCSWTTMYRLLRQAGEVKRRRDQARQRSYTKPELLATSPRELWSWDITKLRGPTPGSYFYLYVIIDVYSRYIVSWMLALREGADLAETLLAETCAKEGIRPEQLTIHADRGSPMTAQCVADLLADLGVRKSHSRPHVSDDNPFSEAQFKTVKYHPTFPERFGSFEDARSWARTFFDWYNHAHYHSGIGLLTPATVHCGAAETVRAARQQVLTAAYQAHPERFVRGHPQPPRVPEAVWINPPAPSSVAGSEDAGAARVESSGQQWALALVARAENAAPLTTGDGAGYPAGVISLAAAA